MLLTSSQLTQSVWIALPLGLLFFLLGTILGSFLNCAAWRMVHHEPVATGRSHCAKCGHPLGAADLVPLVSWLCLKGRCRYCGEPISPRYPLAELLCGIMYLSLLFRFGLTWELCRFLFLLSLLLCAALVDLEDGWIPDRLVIAGAVGFFPLTWLSRGTGEIVNGLIGAAALFFPILIVVLIMDKVLKTETMGGGDLKLFALLGLYFGPAQGLLLVLLSCFAGLIAATIAGELKSRTQAPFGPALFAAAWITAIIGEPLVTWYFSLLW